MERSFIKNMVWDRCMMVVRQQLENLDLKYNNVQLGQAELEAQPFPGTLNLLMDSLQKAGFNSVRLT